MALSACNYYEYHNIFSMLGQKMRDILLDNSDEYKPYPIHETGLLYSSDIENPYKGILVWNSAYYYQGIAAYAAKLMGTNNNLNNNSYYPSDVNGITDTTSTDIGFFVIPEFGGMNIIPNREYKQAITVAFDTNSDLDVDPYGSKIIQIIQWFLNRYTEVMDDWDAELPVSGQKLYNFISGVSRPMYNSGLSSYVRRTVTITVRYCRAGG